MNKWFILPGMGASASMYNALRRTVAFEINFINWPDYRCEKTYADVARRVITEHGISDGDIVGGSSLGGMIALEMAEIVNPKAIILLGSAVTSKEVQNLLAIIAPLVSITPISVIQVLVGKNKNLVSSMFANTNPEFIRAMCTYLSSWAGYQGSLEKVFRLHGKKDLIIPCPTTGCDIVEEAGHLIAMTNVVETTAFLKKAKEKLTSPSSR
jgi:pimeloyl-ACP methyl ester carboxylesterase